jgi:hypothetical protein
LLSLVNVELSSVNFLLLDLFGFNSGCKERRELEMGDRNIVKENIELKTSRF